jgi:hypothetical protein
MSDARLFRLLGAFLYQQLMAVQGATFVTTQFSYHSISTGRPFRHIISPATLTKAVAIRVPLNFG